MTQTSHLKSAAITNLDAGPVVRATAGEGTGGMLRCVDGFVTTVTADAAGSTYQMVRVPSNAKIKQLWFEAAAMSAGKFNLSVYYSSSTTDGTQPALQGIIVPTTGDQFFASDIDATSAIIMTDKTDENATYTVDLRTKPLWQALGLTTDPGGFFDIVAVCHTTAVTTGATMYLSCYYVD
jgi:hypothetical protein